MLREGEELMAWARDPLKSWNEFQLSIDKDFAVLSKADGLVEKVNDDKLARDVDDLTAIFEDLADSADFALPANELETDAAAVSTWIDGLDSDTLNVNELSKAFDALVEDETTQVECATVECGDEDEYMDDSEEDDDMDDDCRAFQPSSIVPSAPVWAFMAPLDPRSCIRGPVFKDIDPRIPCINIPRMDLSNAAGNAPAKSTSVPSASRSCAQSMSPKHSQDKKVKAAEYLHDPKTCWICKSSKTPEKKRALHRYLEKRSRRNWKRGPRYAGRSHVATSRVRNGGRFICTTRWV
jgi:hypothetical protein